MKIEWTPAADVRVDITTPQAKEISRRIEAMRMDDRRVLLGLTGPPGVGKSSMAQYLIGSLSEPAVVVPFDGFHLSNGVLAARGLASRKGSIETFDIAGFSRLVERLRDPSEDIVYAPSYSRDIEEAVAAAIPIPKAVRFLMVEGNYLLADNEELKRARRSLDEIWYLETDDETRRERLIARHLRYGKDHEAAQAWATGSDEDNAAFVRQSRSSADFIVTID